MPGTTPVYAIPYSLPADQVLDFPAAVSKPLADRLEALLAGPYSDLAPVLVMTGWAPGASTLVGRVQRQGKRVHYHGYIILGAGFTMGAGAFQIRCTGLPAASTVYSAGYVVGFKQSGSLFAMANAAPITTRTDFEPRCGTTYLGAQSGWTSAFPWAWGVGDQIGFNLNFETSAA